MPSPIKKNPRKVIKTPQMGAARKLELIQFMCSTAKIEYTGGMYGQFYVSGDIEIRECGLLSSQRFYAASPAEAVHGYFEMLTKVKQPSLINVGGTSQRRVYLWDEDAQRFEFHGSLNDPRVMNRFFPKIT